MLQPAIFVGAAFLLSIRYRPMASTTLLLLRTHTVTQSGPRRCPTAFRVRRQNQVIMQAEELNSLLRLLVR